MKTCVLLNPAAGSASPMVTEIQRQGGVPVWSTHRRGDAFRLAQRAVEDGFERLIIVGGDGTISHTINGLAPSFPVEIAIIPCGTGNDLARSLGIPTDLRRAWEIALSATSVPIDLIRVNDSESNYLVNAATGGFGGTVAADLAAEDKRTWGAFAYWMAGVGKLLHLKPYHLTLNFDGNQLDRQVYGLAVANGRFVGGGFPIAPQALVNDGLCDVTLIPVMSTLDMLAAGLSYSLNFQPRDAGLETFQAKSVRIHVEPDLPMSLDGEPVRGIDASFSVVPGRLRVVVGTGAPAVP